jgi:hypothetical protein
VKANYVIDRLLARQQHSDLVFQLHRLRGFHVAQRRIGREAHRKTARQTFGETRIRRDGSPAVELSRGSHRCSQPAKHGEPENRVQKPK